MIMNHRGIIAAALILVLLIVGMFVFAYIKKNELAAPVPPPTTSSEAPDAVSTNREVVTAKHFYVDGVHTLVGEVDLPTPCHLLNSDARVMESFPEQVVVEFSLVNEADMCAQVITAQRFKVTFAASEDAVISALWDGEPITLNLIPAAPGESPDDYEIYIKG